MKKTMRQIHDDVFNLLMEYHSKDEKFLFTLRQINRAEKLDKGYWLLGNDDYLAVSFWTEKDRLSKMPRIFFNINKNGTSSLELRNEDVSSHYDFFPDQLIMMLQVKPNYKGYNKQFQGVNYTESLVKFLQNEKIIIDTFVESPSNSYSASEWANPIGFINRSNFEKSLNYVNIYRRKLSSSEVSNSGFIRNIDIRNFGPIKQLSIKNLSPKNKWIFLTGENGSGKTSILKAIATAICFNNDKNKVIAKKERFKKFRINYDLFDGRHHSEKYEVNYNDPIDDKKIAIEGFASYGPIRLITQGSLDLKIFKDLTNIEEKLTYGLFNSVCILKDLSKYKYEHNDDLKLIELKKEVLISNLELILPNIWKVEEKSKGTLLFYEFNSEKESKPKGILFKDLPSGTRNFAALILDLLIRLGDQQPELSDPGDYKGIVLIDEIDIHLHPKLQIELIKQLSETFPKVQFIVTTHSPISFLGALDNSVFIKVNMSSTKKGVEITRLTDLEQNFKNLLPNALLTSDLFDLEEIIHKDVNIEEVSTFDSYEKTKIDKELNKQLNILKEKDIDSFTGLFKGVDDEKD